MKRFAITAAAALFIAPVHAQAARDDQLTEDKVRQFIEHASTEAQQMAEKGDWRGIHSWHAEHLTDDAQMAAKATVLTKAGPAMSFEVTMNRDTLDRFAHMMMVSPEQVGPKSIEDFKLTAEVREVTQLPGGQASATVVFRESGTINVAAPGAMGRVRGERERGRREQARGRPEMPTERVVFETTSQCDLRLSADGAEDIKIDMAACEAVTTMG